MSAAMARADSVTSSDRVAVTDALAHHSVARLHSRLAARAAVDAAPLPESRWAAVAAVLRVTDQPELLFIKRAELERDPWSGHVAFPGGRAEAADASLEATAMRETLEELSVDLRDGKILGRLDDLAPRSPVLPPIIIRPFVAVVAPSVVCVPSAEVASAFWVPLSVLRDDAAAAEHVMEINGARARFPAYRVNDHVVWGLTERIVRQLLSLLEP
jgi:8-oxo-dGTP pyrophosphatase MutT (NUDIX family)